MNKYAKEYIRSFANVVNQKNAVWLVELRPLTILVGESMIF